MSDADADLHQRYIRTVAQSSLAELETSNKLYSLGMSMGRSFSHHGPNSFPFMNPEDGASVESPIIISSTSYSAVGGNVSSRQSSASASNSTAPTSTPKAGTEKRF